MVRSLLRMNIPKVSASKYFNSFLRGFRILFPIKLIKSEDLSPLKDRFFELFVGYFKGAIFSTNLYLGNSPAVVF